MKKIKKTKRTSTSLLFIISGLLLLAAVVGLVWQQATVQQLKEEVAMLEKTQLPQKQFASYEDCVNNGGITLWTINIQLSGCLGGEAFPEDKESVEGYVYQAQSFFQYSAQELPRLEAKSDVVGDPSSLADFIKTSVPECKLSLEKEVPHRFALINYNCNNDQSDNKDYWIAIKLADGWRYISTTNHMNEDGVPSCLVVDMFKISKELTPKCFENTGYNNETLRAVTRS